jgi:hypothetical protein
MYKSFLTVSVLAFGSIINPVYALSSYDFSFSATTSSIGSQPISGSGTFTTTDLPNGADATSSVLITNIIGSIFDLSFSNSSAAISTLLPTNAFLGNDNLLFPLALDPNKVSINGVSFNVSSFGSRYNLFKNGSVYQISNDFGKSVTTPTLNLTNVTPVPFEFNPALGIGILGGVWLVRKGLKKKLRKE